jgi:hypothetical protein
MHLPTASPILLRLSAAAGSGDCHASKALHVHVAQCTSQYIKIEFSKAILKLAA